MEHKKSLGFAEKRLETIKEEIQFISDSKNVLKPNDMTFLIDVANLSIAARRFVSLTYPYRFYLKGMNR